jgi:hypothetical protein
MADCADMVFPDLRDHSVQGADLIVRTGRIFAAPALKIAPRCPTQKS